MTPRWRVAAVVLTAALAAMDAGGSNRRQVTRTRDPAFDFDPSLSRDGRRVVFRTSRGRYVPDTNRTGVQGIFVINLDGGGQRRLTHAADQEGPVAWLPDGRIVDASSDGNQPLPSWYLMSPDGTSIGSLPQLQGAGDPIDWLVPVR